GHAHVERDAALAAIVEIEGWVAIDFAAGGEPKERPHGIAGRRLDLDHVRTPIGKNAGRGWCRDPPAHLDHTRSFEHGRLLAPLHGRSGRRRQPSGARPAALTMLGAGHYVSLVAASRPASPSTLPPAVDLGFFRQMADASNEGFYLLNRTGRFLYVNAQGH